MAPKKATQGFTVEVAEERILTCLDKQTEELSIYASTPHTRENQQRIENTLNLLAQVRALKETT